MRLLAIGLVIGIFLGALAGLVAGPFFGVAPTVAGQAKLITQDELNTVELAERSRLAVVEIPTRVEHPPLEGAQEEVPQFVETVGSGFFYEPDRILTNYHVVGENATVRVSLADGTELEARVLGRDSAFDIAVLGIDTPAAPVTLTLGSSAGVRVGQKTIAIGNPFGLERSVSTGIVSGRDRQLPTPSDSDAGLLVDNAIQIDTPVNPGNSGGPLLNSSGEVIGIVTSIVSPNRTFAGIGLAVPIDLVKEVIPDLTTQGFISRPGLGVSVQDVTPELAAELGLPGDDGVVVVTVEDGSPAAQAGIRGASGNGDDLTTADVILSVGDLEVSTSRDLTAAVLARQVGDRVSLTLIREGSQIQVPVTLAERPLP